MNDLLDLFGPAEPVRTQEPVRPAVRIPAGTALCQDTPELRQALTLANPEYTQAQLFGSTVGIAEKLTGYQEVPGGLLVPFPAVGLVSCRVIQGPAVSEIPMPHRPARIRATLRPYQMQAMMAAVDADEGLLVMPPGAGKTVTGLALAHAIDRRPLIFVHTKDLMVQWLRAAEKVLGGTLAVIGGDLPRSEVRGELPELGTVAMMQTLGTWAYIELRQLGERHGVLLADECHHSPCNTLWTILWHVGVSRRFGLTATPKRADGLTPMIHWCMGPVLFRVRNEDLVEAGVSVVPRVRQVQTNFAFSLRRRIEIGEGWKARSLGAGAGPAQVEALLARRARATVPGLDDDGVEWWRQWCDAKGYPSKAMVDTSSMQAMYRALCTDQDRLAIIARETSDLLAQGRVVLVLGGRIEHCKTIADLLGTLGVEAPVLTSRLSAKRRSEVLDRMRAGSVRCAVATSLADEGLDVPGLSGLVLAFPGRSDALTVQRIGRTMRAVPGKLRPEVVDIVDGQIGLLANQATARRRACKREGYEVVR